MQIAVRENVEAGAVLVADDRGQCVLEFLAEADIHQAGVERTTPHAVVKPAWARIRAGDGAGENGFGGDGEHGSGNLVVERMAGIWRQALSSSSSSDHFGTIVEHVQTLWDYSHGASGRT